MRRIIIIIFVLVLCLSLSSNVFALSLKNQDNSSINVFVDGEYMKFATKPFIDKGTTMVPFRAIFEKLGLKVGWDPTTSKATGTKEGLTIILQVGNINATVNGESKTLLVAPKNVKGSVFIPLRFVAENAGRDVVWDGYWREAVIADEIGQIERLLYKHNLHLSFEDPEGLRYGLEPNSNALLIANQSIIPYEFQQDLFHENNTIQNIEIMDDKAFVATAKVVSDANGVNPSKWTKIDYWLVKNQKTKSWSISEMRTNWTAYKVDLIELLNKSIEVPTELQEDITELATKRAAAYTAEDLDMLSPLYEKDTIDTNSLIDYFESTDITHTLSQIDFISSTENEVVIDMTVHEDNPNPYYTESETAAVNYYVTCKKDADGQWLIAEEELVLSTNIWES